jgi:hypothetical protein
MIIDITDELQMKRIKDRNLKNQRYIIRNEMVKFLDILTGFNLKHHELLGMKEKLLDDICKLNTQIAKDNND